MGMSLTKVWVMLFNTYFDSHGHQKRLCVTRSKHVHSIAANGKITLVDGIKRCVFVVVLFVFVFFRASPMFSRPGLVSKLLLFSYMLIIMIRCAVH